jgi:hypothetical protein
MKLVNSILFLLIIDVTTNNTFAQKSVNLNPEKKSPIQKVLNSAWFKVGLGIVGVCGTGGIIWAMRKCSQPKIDQSAPSEQPSSTKPTFPDELFKTIFSHHTTQNKDFLGYSINQIGGTKSFSKEYYVSKKWNGYSICYFIEYQKNKYELNAYYNNEDNILSFVQVLNNFLQTNNIPYSCDKVRYAFYENDTIDYTDPLDNITLS